MLGLDVASQLDFAFRFVITLIAWISNAFVFAIFVTLKIASVRRGVITLVTFVNLPLVHGLLVLLQI